MTVPIKGEHQGTLLVCADLWEGAISPELKAQEIEVAQRSFARMVDPVLASELYLGKVQGRFNKVPKAAFSFSLPCIPADADELINLLHIQAGSKRQKTASAVAGPEPSAAAAAPSAAAESGPSAAAAGPPSAAAGPGPSAAAAEPPAAAAAGLGSGTRVFYRCDGSLLKQTPERMHIAAALKEYLGDITMHTISALLDIRLGLTNEHCDRCRVRVDIMGCEVEGDCTKVRCTVCGADAALCKMVTADWIGAAYRYMGAMNPDSWSSTREMGVQRPSTHGPYFPGGSTYWDRGTFVRQLGGAKGESAWRSFLSKKGYQDINMEDMDQSPLFAFVVELRKDEWGLKIASTLYDMGRTTIILIGWEGTGTGFHLDWARAANWAILLVTGRGLIEKQIAEALAKPMALWAFCHPDKLDKLQAYIMVQWPALGSFRAAAGPVKLTQDQLVQAQEHLGYDAAGRPYLELKQQFSGDLMHVVPGWAHMVLNLQPCLKVAWEYVRAEELSMYVKLWRNIAAPYFTSANDYIAIQSFLKDAVDCSLE